MSRCGFISGVREPGVPVRCWNLSETDALTPPPKSMRRTGAYEIARSLFLRKYRAC